MKKCFRGILFIVVFMFHYGSAKAQVLVHEEPRHRPVFQGQGVRILNVVLPPGDTTQYHIHQTPSVFIFLSNTESGSQLQGGKAITGKYIAGRVLYEDLSPPHVRVHKVWNMDNDTMRVLDIELLSKDTGFILAPLRIPGLELEIENSYVRAYRGTLKTGQEFSSGKQERPLILVSLSDINAVVMQNGKTLSRIMHTGEFITLGKDDSFSVANDGKYSSQFVFIELPLP
ncbi:MAG TPA: hypothetical protein VFX73_02605 [Chitinophagaceae bacterium]|nr:hypothetical protein [Chitinophagaceae bacterium]